MFFTKVLHAMVRISFFIQCTYLTLWEFELVIGIAEHVSDIHVSTNIQKVKLKNVGQIQKSMGPFKKMPLL